LKSVELKTQKISFCCVSLCQFFT